MCERERMYAFVTSMCSRSPARSNSQLQIQWSWQDNFGVKKMYCKNDVVLLLSYIHTHMPMLFICATILTSFCGGHERQVYMLQALFASWQWLRFFLSLSSFFLRSSNLFLIIIEYKSLIFSWILFMNILECWLRPAGPESVGFLEFLFFVCFCSIVLFILCCDAFLCSYVNFDKVVELFVWSVRCSCLIIAWPLCFEWVYCLHMLDIQNTWLNRLNSIFTWSNCFRV